MLKIKLRNKSGQEVTYEQPRVDFGMLNEVLAFNAKQERSSIKQKLLNKKLEDGTITKTELNELLDMTNDDENTLESMKELIIKLFNLPNLTVDKLNKELDLDGGLDQLTEVLNQAAGGASADKNNPAKK